ncbi:MAG: NAD(P)H-hydrate dehydratase, partial [Clostridia bacterium]|nr:NAD(P)H-hydrate dehydratase [Clostridia bacterium]
MMGASLLAHEAALAALRSGAGYAVLCVPKSLASIYMGRVKEEMLYFLPDSDGRIVFDESALSPCLNAGCIVIGPGLGRNKDILKIIGYFSNNYSGTLIIDADGLNVLSEDLSVIDGHKCKLILTPHVGEFKRLFANLAPTIENAKALALKTGSVVVLKSSSTIITDGKITAINITGGPELAKGGSGDVLSGMIGAFSSRFDPFGAACRACWYFGKAGEKAAERMGENSVLASDICGIIREE